MLILTDIDVSLGKIVSSLKPKLITSTFLQEWFPEADKLEELKVCIGVVFSAFSLSLFCAEEYLLL